MYIWYVGTCIWRDLCDPGLTVQRISVMLFYRTVCVPDMGPAFLSGPNFVGTHEYGGNLHHHLQHIEDIPYVAEVR